MKRTTPLKRTPLKRKAALIPAAELASPERGTLTRAPRPAGGRSGAKAGTRPSRPNPPRDALVARPGKRAWYDFPKRGPCENCGKRAYRAAHHVLLAQYVERLVPERIFDVANRWLLCRRCHGGQHAFGVNDTRLDFAKVPPAAVAFAIEVIGEGPATEYFRRRYRGTPDLLPQEAANVGNRTSGRA